MAEIPYTGVPQVPELRPTAPIRVDAPPAAFGTNIAEQIGHLGQVEEGAGKELFDRAYALQEFKVHADVNQRLTDMQNKMTDLTKNYLSTAGSAGYNGYRGYRQSLDDIRSKGGEGLSLTGQELYDNESRQWQYRNALIGAEHAAQQLKQYDTDVANASLKAVRRGVTINPASDDNYNAWMNQAKDTLNHTALKEGWSPEKLDQTTKDVVSDSLLDRAHALAATQPQAAQDLLNKAITNKDVYGDRVEKEVGFINQKVVEVGSRNIANAAMSGAHLEFGEKVVDAPSAQVGIKAIEGGNYSAINPKTGAGGAYQVTPDNLGPWLKEAGMPTMTMEEFTANNPEAHAAQDKLFDFKFGQYMEKYGSFNAAASAWFTGKPDSSMDTSDGYHTLGQYLQISNRALAGRAPLADQVAVGSKLADNTYPGNEEVKEETQRRIESINESNKKITTDTNFQQAKTIYDAINNGVGPEHKLPTTSEELQADPTARQAWDYFATNDPTKLGAFRRALESNGKEDVGKTEERSEEYSKLRGMAINPDTAKDFLALNVNGLDLPREWKRNLNDMQAKIYKNEDAAPQVTHAIQTLRPMLDSINLSRTSDAANYDLFVGTLHDVMTQYQIDNAKPMNDEEITKAGTRLLANVGGQHFWSRTSPWFESTTDVPPEAAEIIRRLPQWGGAVPSDNQVLQTYLAKQYQDQFGKTTAPK
jgi:hypothetical protein